MAHPYRAAGRAGAKSKFRSMLGHDKGAKHFNDDSVARPKPVKKGLEDVKIMAKSAPKRLDRARGGKVTVNIVNPPAQAEPAMPPPPPLPPMPPPEGMPQPPGPGAMMPKPPMGGPAGGPPIMPQPGAGLPLPRADGGRAVIPPRSNRAQKKIMEMQGKINALDPTPKTVKSLANPDWHTDPDKGPARKHGGRLTGGGESGVGRIERSKLAAKKLKKT